MRKKDSVDGQTKAGTSLMLGQGLSIINKFVSYLDLNIA